jgi:hypothetical protein
MRNPEFITTSKDHFGVATSNDSAFNPNTLEQFDTQPILNIKPLDQFSTVWPEKNLTVG